MRISRTKNKYFCYFEAQHFALSEIFCTFASRKGQRKFITQKHMGKIRGRNKEKTYLILFGMLLSIAAPIVVWLYMGKDVHNYTLTFMGEHKVKIFVWAVFFLVSNITNCLCPYTHQFVRSGSHLARIAFVILSFIFAERWWFGFYSVAFLFIPAWLLTKKDDQYEAGYLNVVLSNIGTMISIVVLVFAYLSLFKVIQTKANVKMIFLKAKSQKAKSRRNERAILAISSVFFCYYKKCCYLCNSNVTRTLAHICETKEL